MTIDGCGNIHDSGTGRFAGHAQAETDPGEVLQGNLGIEGLIERGFLSLAARDMDPREAVEQWCEANVATLRERSDLLAKVGLLPRLRPDELVEGDGVDLIPILDTYAATVDDGDRSVAEMEYAEVVAPTDVEQSLAAGYDSQVAIIHTDQGSWGVPDGMLVDVNPSFGRGRCQNCGMPLPGPEHDWAEADCREPATLKLMLS